MAAVLPTPTIGPTGPVPTRPQPTPSNVNLVVNGEFSTDTNLDHRPDGWDMGTSSAFIAYEYPCSQGGGIPSLLFYTPKDSNEKVKQKISNIGWQGIERDG